MKKELDDLEKDGVICRVEEPTEWISSLVITTKKDGSLRLCIDPRKLNQAILRSDYQFPTIDEIKSDLTGAKYFSTLDANKGYWMMRLTETTSKLCTFITPFGR
ncbi:RNA-directed DNA polymerase, partial [Pseudomonas aeruginosa]